MLVQREHSSTLSPDQWLIAQVEAMASILSVNGSHQQTVNGALSGHLDHAAEYEKILRLRDEIFSGSHPRLKVPPHAIRKITPRVAASSPSSISQSNNNAALQNASILPFSSSTPIFDPRPASVSRTTPAKPISELDPIFLTKSDDLVRAEMQLQRRRLEQALREQHEAVAAKADAPGPKFDTRPDFDVAQVLIQALERVPPVALSEKSANGTVATNEESFDENSFYSSRAPDSPPAREHDQPSPQQQQLEAMDVDDLAADLQADHLPSQPAVQDAPTANEQRPPPVALPELPFGIVDRIPPPAPEPVSPNQRGNMPPIRPQPQTEVEDENEYSPPGPHQQRPGRRDSGRFNGDGNKRRSNGRPNRKQAVSPANDVWIVRNHITSPAAPQPSRISTLALAKTPSISQDHSRQSNSNPNNQGQRGKTGQAPIPISPDNSSSSGPSRKRRRGLDNRDNTRNVAARREPDSPEPYIKAEPISPPPFVVQPTSRSRPSEQVVLYEDSGRMTPNQELRRTVSYGELPISPQEPRSGSRISYRRTARDEHDLRRMASLQNARISDVGTVYAEPSPRIARTPGYTIVERSPASYEKVRYYDEPSQVRYVESPAPSRYRMPYEEIDPEPRVMAPPPQRRIVVDENGNQFYEMPPPPRMVRQSVAPPSRQVDAYGEPVSMRSASVRAVSVIDEPMERMERRYVQEIPRGQPTYRQYEYPETVQAPREYIAAGDYDERGQMIRAGSVVMSQPRQPRSGTSYVEEAMPRHEIVRTMSVRPGARYEEVPREIIQRVPSVRPGATGGMREVSVFVDDGRPAMRESSAYMERPGYGFVRQERYMEDDGMGRVVYDGNGEGSSRMSQRY